MARKKSKHKKILKKKKEIDLRSILDKYFLRWRWFVISAIFCFLIAIIYLKLSTTVYQSVTSIIVEDEKNSKTSQEDEIFADLGLVSGLGTRSIENELGLLRSKRLLTDAIKALGLNVAYYEELFFGREELYNNSPYFIELLNANDDVLRRLAKEENNIFELQLLADDNFRVTQVHKDTFYTVKQGSLLKFDFGDLLLRKNQDYDFETYQEEEGKYPEITANVGLVSNLAFKYGSRLEVELIDENATLIRLSMNDPLKRKAQDILNQIVLEYNKEAIEDKNLVAENTAFFIDERLRIINMELDSVESGKEAFKESNNLTNIDVGSSLIMQNASEYSVKEQEVSSQLELVRSMLKYLDSKSDDLLPSNMGVDDAGITELIAEYNSLIIARDKLLVGSTPNNPKVVNYTDQIDQLKKNLKESFRRVRSNLRISRNNLSRQAGIISSQISDVPAQERQFRDIERQQNIKEALYLLLLEKREENSLALAATAPKAKVVDPAYTLEAPVSPNSNIIFFGALLASLFFPVLLIHGRELLNNKIWTAEDIKGQVRNVPIVSEIPHLEEQGIIRSNERTMLSESFRIMAANLQYSRAFKEKVPDIGFCIFVTSSIKGEGKTFTSVNLAMTLALSGRKVVLVGADLRNPQLDLYAKADKKKPGMANYLANPYQQIDYFFVDSKLHENLKILLSGKVPPNPAELLHRDKTSSLFSELKESFDFVIVDTAPVMLIADTFLMSGSADLTLFVTRAGHTKKRLLDFMVDAYNEEKISNPVIVLNDVKPSHAAYGNKYAYGAAEEETDFVSKLKAAFLSISLAAESRFSTLSERIRK